MNTETTVRRPCEAEAVRDGLSQVDRLDAQDLLLRHETQAMAIVSVDLDLDVDAPIDGARDREGVRANPSPARRSRFDHPDSSGLERDDGVLSNELTLAGRDPAGRLFRDLDVQPRRVAVGDLKLLVRLAAEEHADEDRRDGNVGAANAR
jgi:hypothetical protein